MNGKLISLVKTFDSTKWKIMTDALQSPFFNKKPEILSFFLFLKQISKKGYPDNLLQKQILFEKVHPGIAYDDAQFNHLCSGLYKVLERVLALLKMEEDGIQSELYQMQYFLSHDLEKSYGFTQQKAAQKLSSKSKIVESDYLQGGLLADLGDWHFAQQKVRKFDENLQKASDQLDLFYFSRKLRYLCEMMDRQQSLSHQYRLTFSEALHQHLLHNAYDHHPLIRIYAMLFRLFLNETDTKVDFGSFKKLLEAYHTCFEEKDLRTIYYFGINFCIRQFRLGEKSFANDLMDLYQSGFDHKILLDQGKVSPWTFKNVVRLGLGLQRLEWTESFVQDYGPFLPADHQEDAINFNLAEIHYFRKQYDKALVFLHNTKFNDIYYNLDAKVMLAKIYAEKCEYEALDNLLMTFYIFLKRQKDIPRDIKAPYLNFIRFLQQFQRIDHPQKSEIWKEKIAKTKLLTAKNWLLSLQV